jgi:hypothetical protein
MATRGWSSIGSPTTCDVTSHDHTREELEGLSVEGQTSSWYGRRYQTIDMRHAVKQLQARANDCCGRQWIRRRYIARRGTMTVQCPGGQRRISDSPASEDVTGLQVFHHLPIGRRAAITFQPQDISRSRSIGRRGTTARALWSHWTPWSTWRVVTIRRRQHQPWPEHNLRAVNQYRSEILQSTGGMPIASWNIRHRQDHYVDEWPV